MTPSLPQLLIVGAVLLILFQSKNIPRLFSDVGAGIRDFRKNLKDDADKVEYR